MAMPAVFQISNPASASSVMNVTTNGIGSGVTVQLTNASKWRAVSM